MMKKFDKILIAVILIMIIPILFFYTGSGWFIKPTTKTKFSKKQVAKICEAFKINLLPNEAITTEYFPGFLQATTYAKVSIGNIKSEEDFIKRFQGTVLEKVDTGLYDENATPGYYYIEIFELDHIPKDYNSGMRFIENDGKLTCEIHIVGYIPELSNIYKFLIEPFQPVLDNHYLMTFLIIESVLIICLAIRVFIRVRTKRHNLKLEQE